MFRGTYTNGNPPASLILLGGLPPGLLYGLARRAEGCHRKRPATRGMKHIMMSPRDETEETLLAELNAIERWDDDYHLKSENDHFEQESYGLRQKRRKEILHAISTARQAKNI